MARTDDQKATAFAEHFVKTFISESTEILLPDYLPIAENAYKRRNKKPLIL